VARRDHCGLLAAIARRARAGLPYLGVSAGANLACPTIRTTNDMPIVQPASLSALRPGMLPATSSPAMTSPLFSAPAPATIHRPPDRPRASQN
jgi:dipeptidase E